MHRLAGFVGRVKAEIAKAGGTVTGESPGPDGSGHVLRYEVEGRAGEIEMAVTLLDRPDGELARLLRLGGKRDDLGLFRAVAKAEKGPVLVVVVDEKRK